MENEWRRLLEARARPASEVLVTRLGDEIVMLHLTSERYFGLDPVGTAIWEALTTATNIAVAVDALQQRYHVDGQTLAKDVSKMIAQLKGAGLLEVSDSAAA